MRDEWQDIAFGYPHLATTSLGNMTPRELPSFRSLTFTVIGLLAARARGGRAVGRISFQSNERKLAWTNSWSTPSHPSIVREASIGTITILINRLRYKKA